MVSLSKNWEKILTDYREVYLHERGDFMNKKEKSPRYIRVTLSEEEKGGVFHLICEKGEKQIPYEDIPEGMSGKIVCVESKNSLVTSNGWLRESLGEPRKAYLTVEYPTERGEKRKIFMLDSCSLG